MRTYTHIEKIVVLKPTTNNSASYDFLDFIYLFLLFLLHLCVLVVVFFILLFQALYLPFPFLYLFRCISPRQTRTSGVAQWQNKGCDRRSKFEVNIPGDTLTDLMKL